MEYIMWFVGGLLIGLTALSMTIASIGPSKKQFVSHTVDYEKVSEINVAKERRIDFDSDVELLSKMEKKYQKKPQVLVEKSQFKAPMERISQENYRWSGEERP